MGEWLWKWTRRGLTLWAAAAATGCLRPAGEGVLPPDPLLLSRRPVRGNPQTPGAPLFASAEPPAPCLPERVLVAHGGSHTTPADILPAGAQQQVVGVCERHPDYAWLQGYVEKTPGGPIHLRYCEPSEWDSWGGKACLEPDPRLDGLADGTALRVEGGLVWVDGQPCLGPQQYPRYRVRDLRPLR